MNKKSITGILIFSLMAVVLFMNFASAPGVVSKVEITDKQDEYINVVPGTVFCVERTLRNKDIENISPVIAPLFSEGATLESIDVKRVTEEAYLEDVPDWGTCQRTVSEPLPQYDETKCGDLGYSWNGTCYSESTEDYPCITGYHQEGRLREVVNYEPVLGGQYMDGEDSNDDEYTVEIFRSGLPDDVQALENIGYSTSFDLEDEATIRMCFRAPPWGSEIRSGRISYLTYYGNGYDYESSSWWDASWGYKKGINISSVTAETFYQIKVTDNLSDEYVAGKINSTCKDIRFVDSSNVTLNHWIESCNVTENINSTFWVNVTTVDAGNVMIYMYYGNPSANSTSSGNETFILYDHFDSQTALWDTGSGTPTIANSELTVSGKIYNNVLRGIGGVALRLKSRSPAYGVDGFAVNMGDPSQAPAIYIDKTDTAVITVFQGAGRGTYTNDVLTHIWDYNWDSSFVEIWKQNGSEPSALMHNESTNLPDGQNYVFFRDGNYWDWVVLRKYVSPEPITTIGAEETADMAPTISVPTILPAAVYTHTNVNASTTPVDDKNATLQVEYNWTVNGAIKSQGNVSATNDTSVDIPGLGSGNYSGGDVINCSVRAFDGTNWGIWNSSTKTVTGAVVGSEIVSTQNFTINPLGTVLAFGNSTNTVKLQMYSPSHTVFCCGPDNGGTWSCSAGAC